MRAFRCLLIAVLLPSCAVAQVTDGRRLVPATLPNDLQHSLQERFSRFVEAQAAGRWDEVGELMGNRFAPLRTNLYTESYKHCQLSRMQEIRMTDFDYSIRNLLFLEMKDGKAPVQITDDSIWYLKGTATFRTSSKEWKQEEKVAAYRDKGEWYFTPPQWFMEKEWEKAHYVEADFVADLTDEITVQNSSTSPIQITSVHVHMDREFPSQRNLSYMLKNTTTKGIAGFTIEAAMEDPSPGAVVKSGHQNIPPRGYVRGELDTTAYDDYCVGIYKHRLLIEEVRFEDGSTWKPPRSQGQSLVDPNQQR